MHKSKLFELLTTLIPREWKELKKYLLNNTEEQSEVFQLFLRIEKHKSNLAHKHLLIEYQHKKYYSHLTRKTILNLLSKLAKQVERFIVQIEIHRDENILELYKVKALNRRGIYDRANKLGAKMRTKLSDPTHLNLWHPWYLISLNHTLFFSYNPIQNTKEGPALLESCISSTLKLQEYLLSFYVTEAINRENLFKEDWSQTKSLLSHVNNIENKEDNLLFCLYHYYNLRLSYSSENYEKLYKLFFNSTLTINQGVAIPFFLAMHKHLAKVARTGDNKVFQKAANLLYKGIKSAKILYNGKISPNRFISTVTVLSICEEWNKAKDILLMGADILPISDRIQAQAIAEMNVLLRQNNTNDLAKLYHRTQFQSIEYKSNAISLFLRAIYQDPIEDRDFINTQIRNYSDFLRRHKNDFGDNKLEGEWNFISILKMLINGTGHDSISRKLRSLDNVYYRTWLESQLEKERQP